MTVRVLRGKRSDGTLGFDISKPGFDVRTADKMHMAFSSDLKNPRVVVAGQATINPTNGVRSKDFNIPGGQATVLTIPFGQTLAVRPVVVAVGKCASWSIPLPLGNRTILSGLAGNYISPIYENFITPGDLTYGTNVNHNLGDANSVSASWAACRFYYTVAYDSFTITFNGSVAMTVKYLVLRYP
jgi:hypothetical protein